MSENHEYILPYWETESLIENLQLSELDEIASKKWFEYHQKLLLLHQQSILEITTSREETVKECLVNFRKISILIYEAIQISVWKEKVFPLIIDASGEPTNTFMMYSVFYHEDMVVSLLENVLFHSDSIETLEDSALDLIDYLVGNVSTTIFHQEETGRFAPDNTTCLEELISKKAELEFDISIKCITILGYLASFVEFLSLAVIKRLLVTHDVPYLLAKLIEKKPWKRINSNEVCMIYTTSQWKKIKENEVDKIPKVEGQVWFGLRELLLNSKCTPYYPINEFRASELSKLQKYLHDQVLDQIPPLVDLLRWLSYLNLSPPPGPSLNPSVSVEIIPQMRLSVLAKYNKKWKKIAKYQCELFYNKDINHIKSYAKILSAAYDIDKIAATVTNECAVCAEIAAKRCSQCRMVWYCSRECQVKDWAVHKNKCAELMKNKD